MKKSANALDANNDKKPRKKRAGNNGNGFKPGQSGNPKGRPKDGESQAAIMSKLLNMTADEIVDLVGKSNDLGAAFLMMPKGIQMKYLLQARVISALMFEPTATLLNVILDRTEGKVKEQHEITGPNNGPIEFVEIVKTYEKPEQ